MEVERKDVKKDQESDGRTEVLRTFQLPLFVLIIINECVVSIVIYKGLTYYLIYCDIFLYLYFKVI